MSFASSTNSAAMSTARCGPTRSTLLFALTLLGLTNFPPNPCAFLAHH